MVAGKVASLKSSLRLTLLEGVEFETSNRVGSLPRRLREPLCVGVGNWSELARSTRSGIFAEDEGVQGVDDPYIPNAEYLVPRGTLVFNVSCGRLDNVHGLAFWSKEDDGLRGEDFEIRTDIGFLGVDGAALDMAFGFFGGSLVGLCTAAGIGFAISGGIRDSGGSSSLLAGFLRSIPGFIVFTKASIAPAFVGSCLLLFFPSVTRSLAFRVANCLGSLIASSQFSTKSGTPNLT